MLPLTILASQKLADLLTQIPGLAEEVQTISAGELDPPPPISSQQVFVSAAPIEIAEKRQQLAYPRVGIFCEKFKNTQWEKFRSISGSASVIAEIAITGNLVEQADRWIHFYVEAVTNILRRNAGDWGDGVFFSGGYSVALGVPRPGAAGFLQVAQVSCELAVSRS